MSFIQNFIKNYIPKVKADDEEGELVDPQKVLREKCSEKHCTSFQEQLNICNDRVNSRKNTEESCFEELVNYVECVDHCVAKTLFSKLK